MASKLKEKYKAKIALLDERVVEINKLIDAMEDKESQEYQDLVDECMDKMCTVNMYLRAMGEGEYGYDL